jgi:alkanesulfonate monooxygenase SsuD/methylene tetrahydromethanopterin reductase-like flavin-dependent oxidoreductase (luciferase family)
VQEAEALGFDSVWVADHLFLEQGEDKYRDMPEPLALIGALAAVTTRITFGTLVLCQAFRHPGHLAKAAATISEVSDGRFILGIGAGWHEPEYRAFGLPFSNKVSRLDEYLTVLRDLFQDGRSDFQGNYFQMQNAKLFAEKVPPIWVAARGPKMLDLTARHASGWNTAWHGDDLPSFQQYLALLRRTESSELRPQAVQASVGLLVVPTSNSAEADGVWSQLTSLSSLEAQAEDQLRRRVIVADPDRTAQIISSFWVGGADHIIVSPGAAPFATWRQDSIRTLGTAVLPLLR